MRRLRPLLLLVMLAPACGTVTVHDGPASMRRIPARSVDLHAALLTREQALPVLGPVRRTPASSDTTPNPDPRGPCGATATQPSRQDGALVEFERAAPPLRLLQWVADLPAGVAQRTIAAAAADVRPGCPPYSTATPYGHPQRNRFVRTFRLAPVGDQRFAFEIWGRVEASGNPGVYGAEILVRRSRRLTIVALESLDPLAPALVRAVAARAAADMTPRPAASA